MEDSKQIDVMAKFLQRNYYDFCKEHSGKYWYDIAIALIKKLDNKKDNVYINNEGAKLTVKVVNEDINDKIKRKAKEFVVSFKDGEILFIEGYAIDDSNDENFIIIEDTFINKSEIKYIKQND